jgi:hypothetical protein
MTGAWLVVRAVVADPDDRAAFDTWYHQEHLPDATKAFSASAPGGDGVRQSHPPTVHIIDLSRWISLMP